MTNTNLKSAVVTPPPLALRVNLSNTRIVFVETVRFRVELLDNKGTPIVILNNGNVVTMLEFSEDDDRCFATTDDANLFHTMTTGTAEHSGMAYFNQERICLPGFLPALSGSANSIDGRETRGSRFPRRHCGHALFPANRLDSVFFVNHHRL